MKFFVIILALASFSQQCSDFIHDIHSFISTIGDVFSTTEANMRIQYNTIQAERVKTVATQMTMLKNMQNNLQENLCRYQYTEDSVNMLNIGQEVIGDVRKNLIYAVRASFEDMRNDHSNIIYNHLVMVQDFLEDFAEPSKSYFTDGKICVMALEPNIRNFLESSANRIVQCMRNATVTSPLQYPKFKVEMGSIEDAYSKHVANIRRPFNNPYIIYQYSTKEANQTAANNLFAYMKTQLDATLEIVKSVAVVGLNMVDSIVGYNDAVKKCVRLQNVTYISPKRDEILGNVKYCSGV